MKPPLELYDGTQASLPELILLAAEEGFDTLTTTAALVDRAGMSLGELRKRCEDSGVAIGYIDGLHSPLSEAPPGVSEERCYDIAEGLGAPAINAVHLNGPPVPFADMLDALGGLVERAARREYSILIEFLPGTGIPDFPVALDLVRQIDDDHLRVMLDAWHLARSGEVQPRQSRRTRP
jgi:sugar phosphate isomerase/epimerase